MSLALDEPLARFVEHEGDVTQSVSAFRDVYQNVRGALKVFARHFHQIARLKPAESESTPFKMRCKRAERCSSRGAKI